MVIKKIFFKISLVAILFMLNPMNLVAQNKSFSFNDKVSNDNIVMTWNKNTPETEMKDDVKALADKGITIKYSNVKRNSKNEITAIKVDYSDRKGNKGSMELNNQNPINTIKFFKQDEVVGFGEPSNYGNSFMNGFANVDDIMKQFKFQNNDPNSQSFQFDFSGDGSSMKQSKSKITIQKEGKKPLVIEDGIVVEGGDDYSAEELEKIKNENKVEKFDYDDNSKKEFDFRNQDGLDDFKSQIEKMKTQIKSFSPENKSELEKSKDEMIKAKDEMNKAREELEKAKKELEQSRTKLKSQKI